MFTIMYEFIVKAENSPRFTQIWHELTFKIKSLNSNSLGARLHKLNETAWIAYAMWSSKDAWEASDMNQPEIVELRKELIGCCEDVGIIFQMDVYDDLLS